MGLSQVLAIKIVNTIETKIEKLTQSRSVPIPCYSDNLWGVGFPTILTVRRLQVQVVVKLFN